MNTAVYLYSCIHLFYVLLCRHHTYRAAYNQPQQQLANTLLLFGPHLLLQSIVHFPKNAVLLAEKPSFFLGCRRVAVQLGDQLRRALAFRGERFTHRLHLGHQRGVIGYHLADITLRGLYLPVLGQRCGCVRRK